MSMSDEDVAKVRSAGTYRAAMWLNRFNWLLCLGYVWLVWGRQHVPGLAQLGLLLLIGVILMLVMMLMRRAGVPFGRGFFIWQIEGDRIRRVVRRDMFLAR